MSNLIVFDTGKVELCFVLTESISKNFSIEVNGKGIPVLNYFIENDPYSNHKKVLLSKGNWIYKGSPFDVTEEEAKSLVLNFNRTTRYHEYPIVTPHKFFDSALASWNSLLSDLQIYRENPVKRPNEGEPDEDVFWEKASQYQWGESRSGNWVFMIKSK